MRYFDDPDEAIRAAHNAELDELDDGLVADDHWGRNGFGEVLWMTPDHKILVRRLP